MSMIKPLIVRYIPPFLLNTHLYDLLGETPSKMDDTFPCPTWTFAKKRDDGHTLPQTIAHRGYKAKYPENTMGAIRGAVEAGVDAIETDLHISQDHQVDPDLKRCFGTDKKIADCDWDYLKTLKTRRAPHEHIPRLTDVLAYLALPDRQDVWLLLDIKMHDDADMMIRLIAETIGQVPPNPLKHWNQRIVLGCWAVKYLPLCAHYLPGFAVSHIGFSTAYARQFLSVPSLSFNLLQMPLLLWPLGPRLVRDIQAHDRPLYIWTVNEEAMMRWCINQGVDAVVTDDPQRFREVKDRWLKGNRHFDHTPFLWLQMLYYHFLTAIFGIIFRWRMGRSVGKSRIDVKG